MPCLFNAANVLAVRKFLNREIGFLQIAELIEDTMNAHEVISAPTLEEIIRTL